LKANTLIGILIGLLAIFGAFLWEGGSFETLFLLPPMLIVIGGTLAAGLAGHSFELMAKIPRLFYISFTFKSTDNKKIIEQVVDYAQIARKNGILSLEKHLDEMKHPYLRKLFKICIDGADPETLERIVETELYHMNERHIKNINLFSKLGGYSPTMGIIGTVMGLISTLAAAGQEPNVLIRHIASAFIATMWGILLANIVWLPVADKLMNIHKEEMRVIKLMLEGVKSVQLGEVPSVIRAKMMTSLPMQEQLIIEEKENVSYYIPAKKLDSDDEEDKNEKQKNDKNINFDNYLNI
jgi:chemotaxis protein MotA